MQRASLFECVFTTVEAITTFALRCTFHTWIVAFTIFFIAHSFLAITSWFISYSLLVIGAFDDLYLAGKSLRIFPQYNIFCMFKFLFTVLIVTTGMTLTFICTQLPARKALTVHKNTFRFVTFTWKLSSSCLRSGSFIGLNNCILILWNWRGYNQIIFSWIITNEFDRNTILHNGNILRHSEAHDRYYHGGMLTILAFLLFVYTIAITHAVRVSKLWCHLWFFGDFFEEIVILVLLL
jgi:hypothetical protein